MENTEFNVGDTVWWATCENESVRKPCPICFGKYVVTLILGNDEHVQTPCDFCRTGFQVSSGYINEYEWKSNVKAVILTGKQVNERNGVREVEYRYDNYILRHDNAFRKKEEADARVLELIAQHEAEEKARMEHRKEQDKKSYAWHVGYHKRCAKLARRQLEYHEKKVITMKNRSLPL